MSSTESLYGDTIFALATAPGKAGVAIVRLSGPHALTALQQLTGQRAIAPRHAHYVTFSAPHTHTVIDRGLALYFNAPHSFTGEDVVECHVHGGFAVIRELLEVLAGMDGVRHAEPGEFSRRAFAYGKMDLIEAEGLADLVDAETSRQKLQALNQMQGGLSGFYENLRERITVALALLEAYIDFPDEEIPESVLRTLESDLNAIKRDISASLADGNRGERLRDGINVVILGAPNAGKSSLLNAIAKRDVAIVSTKAGTTRDTIEIHLDIAGYPVIVVDTAGLRESDEEIEAEGIRRALARAASADIKLVLFDGAQWPKLDEGSKALLDAQSIAVVSKSDLLSSHAHPDFHFISTQTGEGVDALLAALGERIIHAFSAHCAPVITRTRHRALLAETLKSIDKSMEKAPLELQCEELRRAGQAVGKITGKIQVDDVLEVIFKRFCIGK